MYDSVCVSCPIPGDYGSFIQGSMGQGKVWKPLQ